jgi:hypothetical protein
MLTDNDRERIRAEEAFRHALRQEITQSGPAPAKKEPEKPPTLWQKFMAFANTSFGIWALSTVAIGGISSGYQLISHHYEMVRQDEARAHRLQSEIVNRFDQMTEKLAGGRDKTVILDALKELDSGSVKMFDDLVEKNVVTLAVQLRDLVGAKDQAQIDLALPILREMVLLNQLVRQNGAAGPVPSDADAYAKLTAALDKLGKLKLYTPHTARGKS